MGLLSAFLRWLLLIAVLSALFFTGMLVFGAVICILLGLAAVEFLRRRKVLNEELFNGRVEMPHHTVANGDVFESRVIEAQYTEINR